MNTSKDLLLKQVMDLGQQHRDLESIREATLAHIRRNRGELAAITQQYIEQEQSALITLSGAENLIQQNRDSLKRTIETIVQLNKEAHNAT